MGETPKPFTCVYQLKGEEEYELVKNIACCIMRNMVSLFTQITNSPGMIIKGLYNIYSNMNLEKQVEWSFVVSHMLHHDKALLYYGLNFDKTK